MTTALDLIKDAARKIGVTGTGQSFPAEEAADAMRTLNQMLSSWSIEGAMVYNLARESFALTAGQYSYTIGSGGNFNTTRPIEIIAAFIRNASNFDTPLDVVNAVAYAEIPDKINQSTPDTLYYASDYPTGYIILNPAPISGLTLNLYSKKALTAVAALSTTLDLPPGHELAVVTNLAVIMAPEYEKEASLSVKQQAASSKALIKDATRKNDTPTRAIDYPAPGSHVYNILRGY